MWPTFSRRFDSSFRPTSAFIHSLDVYLPWANIVVRWIFNQIQTSMEIQLIYSQRIGILFDLFIANVMISILACFMFFNIAVDWHWWYVTAVTCQIESKTRRKTFKIDWYWRLEYGNQWNFGMGHRFRKCGERRGNGGKLG